MDDNEEDKDDVRPLEKDDVVKLVLAHILRKYAAIAQEFKVEKILPN